MDVSERHDCSIDDAEMCCFNVEAFASLAWCGKGLLLTM